MSIYSVYFYDVNGQEEHQYFLELGASEAHELFKRLEKLYWARRDEPLISDPWGVTPMHVDDQDELDMDEVLTDLEANLEPDEIAVPAGE